MNLQPQGEELRKAVKWISEQRESKVKIPPKELIRQASVQFDLSPLDEDYLMRNFFKRT